MNADEMIRLMSRSPFEPFEVRFSDGARILVEHPWEISTRPDSPTCTIYEAEEGMRIVAYRNITGVVTVAPVDQ